MKKVLITSLFFLILFGCSKIDDKKEIYNELLRSLKEIDKSSENLPFDINIETEELIKGEYIYVISVDNPKKELKNIEIIMTHNYKTKDIFPSSGIFDEKLNLIPDTINEDKNIVKGILLVGYIESEELENIEFKVLVKSNDKEYYLVK